MEEEEHNGETWMVSGIPVTIPEAAQKLSLAKPEEIIEVAGTLRADDTLNPDQVVMDLIPTRTEE